ncbi:MAG: muramidase [Syntrophomonadaceae bacterium]|nr:muramidase [Syntrophomonadaceae bacterium]
MKIDLIGSNSTPTQALDTMSASKENKDFNKILDKALQEKDDKKLYEACVELESVFLSKVLNAMRASIPRSDLIERSFATETFESMLFDEYAKEMSKTGSTGIAEMIYNQLKSK